MSAKYKPGDVVTMKGGTIAEITSVEPNEHGPAYSIAYLDPRQDPTGPLMAGGGSAWWAESDFAPVTDPILLLRIALTQKTRIVEEAKKAAKLARRDIARLRYALSIALAAPKPPA